jgi:hypothetical protein
METIREEWPVKEKSETMNPISPKVWAAAIGAGAGTILSTFLLWLLGAGIFHGGWSADRVDNAIAAVPTPLSLFVGLLVTLGLTAIGAYAKTDPERLPTLGSEQRKRVGLQGIDVRPRRADLSENDTDRDVIR